MDEEPKQEVSDNTLAMTDPEPKQQSVGIDENALKMHLADLNENYSENIRQLMTKIETMGDTIANMQMNVERQEQEFKVKLEQEYQRAYNEGENFGRQSEQKALEEESQRRFNLIQTSIQRLEEVAEQFKQGTQNLEEQLSDAALDIARSVIAKEVSEDSKSIAVNIAQSLIKDVNKAMQIFIKVSPYDEEALKSSFEHVQHIKILRDEALNRGGVIILSDAGNIDSRLEERFKEIKNKILQEKQ